ESIVEHIESSLISSSFSSSSLKGRSVVVTAGPTREKIDDVRFLSNYSSGKMGFAIARAAAIRGASVTLITGPVSLPTPPGVERIDVESAIEMREASGNFFRSCDIFIGAAAVADYRPSLVFPGKLKKNEPEIQFTLQKNPDILADFGHQKNTGQIAAGFALEQENGIGNARKKLEEKNLDLIALNFSDRKTSGFEVDTNMLTLIERGGPVTELPLVSKDEAARKLLDAIENICRQT
ncbi:MAG: bifunctional phosphopantothenoylcysteine decarboxylase/phosphopantothenate--cysteine ligase CoaBC, partial [Chlorobiaceae bacterium]|nr:bifunctional phosphopantothenoylcysteine decarboxylase/phosphopantothenate--cysteine ligase CoaBC [Chlorobiaceae bacterium]